MKGIPMVILCEEPNLEGNISQLGGKYHDISLRYKITIIHKHKQYAVRSYQNSQSLLHIGYHSSPSASNATPYGRQAFSFVCKYAGWHVRHSTPIPCDQEKLQSTEVHSSGKIGLSTVFSDGSEDRESQ